LDFSASKPDDPFVEV